MEVLEGPFKHQDLNCGALKQGIFFSSCIWRMPIKRQSLEKSEQGIPAKWRKCLSRHFNISHFRFPYLLFPSLPLSYTLRLNNTCTIKFRCIMLLNALSMPSNHCMLSWKSSTVQFSNVFGSLPLFHLLSHSSPVLKPTMCHHSYPIYLPAGILCNPMEEVLAIFLSPSQKIVFISQ